MSTVATKPGLPQALVSPPPATSPADGGEPRTSRDTFGQRDEDKNPDYSRPDVAGQAIVAIKQELHATKNELRKEMKAHVDRIDAKIERIVVHLNRDSKITNKNTENVEARFDRVDARFDGVEKYVEARFDRLENEVKSMRNDMNSIQSDIRIIMQTLRAQQGSSSQLPPLVAERPSSIHPLDDVNDDSRSLSSNSNASQRSAAGPSSRRRARDASAKQSTVQVNLSEKELKVTQRVLRKLSSFFEKKDTP
ncbi:hypothetical protein C8Q74DRAFT_1219773 [Fomes fomentarius]|nr:hypothetical protein C8Q74DRAFT_1219773 [Fomes fomentarius]